MRPPQHLSNQPGFHRFVWDVRYSPIPGIKPEYPIAAVYKNTAPAATSPWAMPGKYKVVLTAGSQKYTQDLTLAMDPRIKTPAAGLQEQFDLSQQVYHLLQALQPINDQVDQLRAQVKAQREKTPSDAAKLDAFSQKLDAFAGAGGRRRRGNQQAPTLGSVRGSLFEVFSVLQDADVTPTPNAVQAVKTLTPNAANLQKQWEEFQKTEVPQLKSELGIKDLPNVGSMPGSAEGMNQDEE